MKSDVFGSATDCRWFAVDMLNTSHTTQELSIEETDSQNATHPNLPRYNGGPTGTSSTQRY
eukprot:3689949-Amphidinium_carterae.1